jgi:gamma-glutamyltranspeptidase/glutathione hydrolase
VLEAKRAGARGVVADDMTACTDTSAAVKFEGAAAALAGRAPVPSSRRFALLLVALTAACGAPASEIDGRPGPLASAAPVASASAAPAAPPVAARQPAAPDPPIQLQGGGAQAVRGDGGVVTSVEAHASRAGADVLKRGGSAVDAAVATAFVLAVTHPSAGNLGGGGFMIVRARAPRAADDPSGAHAEVEVVAIDFREVAPAAATDEKNRAQLDAGAVGWASAAVPGTVAGLELAHARFGKLPWAELVAPAIALAKKGHKLGARQAAVLSWNWSKLVHDPAARAAYGHGKQALKEGDVWKQPDLARTLEAIAKEGAKGFYEGPVAAKIDAAMRAHGGLVTAEDLKRYKATSRAPLHFTYRGFDVDTMPPPSMGGVAFAETMLELERWEAWRAPANSGASLHAFVEAARRAYAERRSVGGDPDFQGAHANDAAVASLLSPSHVATRVPFDPEHATPSSAVEQKGPPAPHESTQTTHLSVVDAEGNAVALTTTLSAAFGAKVIAAGTGVLFGNAMGAFSPSGVNALAPGKRMASSMTPAIVTQGGKLAAVLGSPGGDTIPNTVSQVMRNLVDYGMTIDKAVAAPRVHHQLFPDKVRVEKLNPPPRAALDELVKRGHLLDLDVTPIGDANDVVVDRDGVAWATADAREGGKAAAAR